MPHMPSTDAEEQWLAYYQQWVRNDPHVQMVNHIMESEFHDERVFMAARHLWSTIVDRKVAAEGNPLDWNLYLPYEDPGYRIVKES